MNEMLTEFTVIFTFISIHGLRPSHDEDRIIDKENNVCSQFYTDAMSITVSELCGEMCTAWLFSQGVDLFALKFYLDEVVPHQPFLASEN